MDLTAALNELRHRNQAVPRPLRLPTDQDVATAERELGVSFPAEYRRYLLEASDVVVGTLEPCVVVPGAGYLDLVQTTRRAWDAGVPDDLIPICEDNGDYYCLDHDRVRFWSHDGTTDEAWPNLASWIAEVWIGERA